MSARGGAPVVVVGAGVAGLRCAQVLASRGVPVQVLEAADAVGGRVRSDLVDGFRLDRGFQVLLTAYPEVQASLDLAALGLGRFLPGALVRIGGRFERIVDPVRRPAEALDALRAPVGTLGDALRILAWRRRLVRADVASLLAAPSRPAREHLARAGFSDRVVERFFRPFFGGVFLEDGLETSSRFLEFAFAMFARGDAALPAEGMGAVPQQLAQRLPQGTIRLGAAVERVHEEGVVLEGGEAVEARAVVIATAGGAAARLSPELAAPPSNPATCLTFDAPEAPPVGRALVLDADRSGPVHHLCVPSAVCPSHAPRGRALVSASVLGADAGSDAQLEAAAREQLGRWFGGGVDRWRLLRVDRIAEALPRQLPGPFEPAERAVRLGPHRLVCGDHRDVASLQGAMSSGRRAAEAVLAEEAQ